MEQKMSGLFTLLNTREFDVYFFTASIKGLNLSQS